MPELGKTNFSSSVETGAERENRRFLSFKKLGVAGLMGLGIAAGAGGLSALEATPVAHADYNVDIVVGGATDNLSFGAMNTLIDNGTINPNAANVIPIAYPAEMGPFVGSTPTKDSVAQGVAAVEDTVRANLGANITLYGFSEGDFVTNGAAADLASQGINVQVINAGDGNSATGILSSPEAQLFMPFVNAFGIEQTPPVPGTVENLDGNDVWASTGDGRLGKMFYDAVNIPQFHRIPGANEVPVQRFTLDGVQYNVFSTAIPMPDGAIAD